MKKTHLILQSLFGLCLLVGIVPVSAQYNFDCSSVTEIPIIECEALVALYNDSQIGNGLYLYNERLLADSYPEYDFYYEYREEVNWLRSETPCSWHGITCDNGHVSSLDFVTDGGTNWWYLVPYDDDFGATVAPEIGNLSHLTYLNLGGNLSGIPPEIWSLTNLTHLYLYSNRLETVPNQISNLSNLTHLSLSSNELTTIPLEVLNLPNLTFLDLSYHTLTNLSEVGSLANLTQLHLRGTELIAIPPEIYSLSNLTSLGLRSNQLTELPSQIDDLSNLTYLDLGVNQLTELPQEISDLSNLTYLDLGSNQLTELPQEIGDLSNLTYLDLGSNQLTELPQEIGVLSNLTSLGLAYNPLQAWPSTIANLTEVDTLRLYNLCDPDQQSIQTWIDNINNVHGSTVGTVCSESFFTLGCLSVTEIPNIECEALVAFYNSTNGESWSYDRDGWLITVTPCSWRGITCESGTVTQIDKSSLSGDLPVEITNLPNLVSLNLNSSQLTTLPAEIGSLSNLTFLGLRSNQLTTIPTEIGNLSNLIHLELGRNQLTELPQEIGDLSNLIHLELTSNQLTELPSEIGDLSNLTSLDLAYNPLQAWPSTITNLTNVETLSVEGLCQPDDIAVQDWINNVDTLSGTTTDILCSETAPLSINMSEVFVRSEQHGQLILLTTFLVMTSIGLLKRSQITQLFSSLTFSLLLSSLILLLLMMQVGLQPAAAQDNLLENPSFEGDYSAWLPQYTTAQMAPNWTPWWLYDEDHEPVWGQPEYKKAEKFLYGDRVLDGDAAQQYFTFYKSHYGGIYQQVQNVTPGMTYRFSIWVKVWSSTEDDIDSVLPADPNLQIGIDPTGSIPSGFNDAPSTVVWGSLTDMNAYVDTWHQFSVDVTAQNSTITVYTKSSPQFAVKHNDIFLDAASLTAIEIETDPLNIDKLETFVHGKHYEQSILLMILLTATLTLLVGLPKSWRIRDLKLR